MSRSHEWSQKFQRAILTTSIAGCRVGFSWANREISEQNVMSAGNSQGSDLWQLRHTSAKILIATMAFIQPVASVGVGQTFSGVCRHYSHRSVSSSSFRSFRRARVRCTLDTQDESSAANPAVTSVSSSQVEQSPTVSTPKPSQGISDGSVPFEIRGFSLANVGLLAGLVITGVSFSSYFTSNGTASATSLGFVYGVPILLIGCALKYAELKPVPLLSTPEAAKLREKLGTDIQRKIVSDVTRHRYGDEAHLSAALSSLGLVIRGSPCPQLISARESVTEDSQYCLGLDFVSSDTPYSYWEERIAKYERFFGPNIKAEVQKLDQEKRMVQLRLISTNQ